MSELDKFKEWADRVFGSNFKMEELLTYHRMSAAYEAGYAKAMREVSEVEPVGTVGLEPNLPIVTLYGTHIPTESTKKVVMLFKDIELGTLLIPRPKGTDHE